jgi:hypothetical protein
MSPVRLSHRARRFVALALAASLLPVGCRGGSTEPARLAVSLDRQEYAVGETIPIVVHNVTGAPVELGACEPYVVERQGERGAWGEVFRVSGGMPCLGVGFVVNAGASLRLDGFLLPPTLMPGTHWLRLVNFRSAVSPAFSVR